MKKLLVIGKNWPEPQTTAAGYRILQLLEVFQEDGYQVTFSCAGCKSAYSVDLVGLNIIEKEILLNDSSFDNFIKELSPDIVLYDRFMTEEQYSWRVKDNSPQTLHILDTEDLHFLRMARQVAIKKKTDIDIYNDAAVREIAAIYRCDLSIIISKVEHDILINKFDIPVNKLIYIPFLHKKDKLKTAFLHKGFDDRSNFVMMGNSLHQPNYDSILYLKNKIWPQIRNKLPNVEVHVYGAYQNESLKKLHHIEQGFIIKGHAINAIQTLREYRLLLAPLRFGAGLKGKIFDALQAATPVAMSQIAAEGMFTDKQNFGLIENNVDAYVEKVIDLYHNQQQWEELSSGSLKILENNFSHSAFAKTLLLKISSIIITRETKNNKEDFFIKMLNFHSTSRYKYLSKWIDLKNNPK
ncbi:glycosyltransferase [uncultured Nonlabens sp.]|uniref:glycosyltransferase n=1 Tax=uncultured Nonlabens sp. TaxID=859306 RepID=UPI00261BA1B3|nr:glycosyltransferase [uncultured Nonlabens sp.]